MFKLKIETNFHLKIENLIKSWHPKLLSFIMWLKIHAVFIWPHIMTQICMKYQYEKQKPTWRHKPSLSIWTTPGCGPAFWGPPTCMQLFTLEFVSVVMTTLNLMLFTGDSIMTLVAARPGSQAVRGKLNRHLDWVLGRYNDKLIYSIVYTPHSKGNKAFVTHNTPVFADAGSAKQTNEHFLHRNTKEFHCVCSDISWTSIICWHLSSHISTCWVWLCLMATSSHMKT